MGQQMEFRVKGGERRGEDSPRRKPLKLDIAEVDQEILRLLIRRHNMLSRMKDRKGRLDPAEEKFLRESWQAAVAKVSRDAALSGHFFTLMQEISFLPRPAKTEADESALKGSDRRQSFNLAPPRQPVNIAMTAPRSSFSTCSWLYLAAAHGAPALLENCLLNDGEIDLLKALNQMGAALNREETGICARSAAPIEAPDKVLHIGDSHFNLYLVLAHYLGRPSRVKLSSDSGLKLANLSFLHPLLLECGARLVHVVPKSSGLPARLEASGILPPGIAFTPNLPPELACALLLAATAWSSPFSLDLTPHPRKENIFARVLPILEAAGAVFKVDGASVSIEPAPLAIPQKPVMPVEPLLAAFLLAFAAPFGGGVKLAGSWPAWPDCDVLWRLMESMGLAASKNPGQISLSTAGSAKINSPGGLDAGLLASLDEEYMPLPIALAACGTLLKQKEAIPTAWPLHADTGNFLHSLALEASENGELAIASTVGEIPAFNAPDSSWAFALSLAAMCRDRNQLVRLGNPGIITALWPGFWSLYNTLPAPAAKVREEKTEKPKNRRRILTNAVAVPPEIKEEDWF